MLGLNATRGPASSTSNSNRCIMRTGHAEDKSTPDSLPEWAERYSGEFGWAIIPTRGKQAACRWKRFQTGNKPAANQIRRWLGLPGVTGIAVLHGKPSLGLACRDFDRAESYYRWAEVHPD